MVLVAWRGATLNEFNFSMNCCSIKLLVLLLLLVLCESFCVSFGGTFVEQMIEALIFIVYTV